MSRAVFEGRTAELVAAVYRVDSRALRGCNLIRRPFVPGELGEHGPSARDADRWGVEVAIVGGRYAREPYVRRDGRPAFTDAERRRYRAAVAREVAK